MLKRSRAKLLWLLLAVTIPCIHSKAQVWSPDARQLIIEGRPPLRIDFTSASAAVAPVPAPFLHNQETASLFSYSPDGKALAYRNAQGNLVLMDIANGASTTMESNLVAPVSWSPDSKLLAAVCKDSLGRLILHMDYREGGYRIKPVVLPFHQLATSCQPVQWVPETDNVVIAGGDERRTDIWLVDVGIPSRLTQTGDVLAFAISPDGSRVIWLRRSPNTHYILFSLYELRIDARTLQKLDFPNRLPQVNPNPHDAVDSVTMATFSPDLTRIAFSTEKGKRPAVNALWVTDIKGSTVQRVAALAPDAPPAFSPDSKLLASVGLQKGAHILVLFDLVANQSRILALPSGQ